MYLEKAKCWDTSKLYPSCRRLYSKKRCVQIVRIREVMKKLPTVGFREGNDVPPICQVRFYTPSHKFPDAMSLEDCMCSSHVSQLVLLCLQWLSVAISSLTNEFRKLSTSFILSKKVGIATFLEKL